MFRTRLLSYAHFKILRLIDTRGSQVEYGRENTIFNRLILMRSIQTVETMISSIIYSLYKQMCSSFELSVFQSSIYYLVSVYFSAKFKGFFWILGAKYRPKHIEA